jgi:hypothetical protein
VNPAERAALRAGIWASAGMAAAVPLLVIPQPGTGPRLPALVHLGLLGAFAIGLAFHLAPVADRPWLTGTTIGEAARWAGAGLVVAAMVAASASGVAVATGAALRFDPSLQYLQVLATLHLSVTASLVVLGARRRFGGAIAAVGAAAMVAAGLWTEWRYLGAVGFTPAGGWVVDGSEMRVIVLPFLAGSAAAAAAAFAAGAGSRRTAPGTGGPGLPPDPGPVTF